MSPHPLPYQVKLLVGPNGTTIGTIQRKSKARVQVRYCLFRTL